MIGVGLKIILNPFSKNLRTQEKGDLFQDRSTFSIGDSVKICRSVLGIGDVHFDRVSGNELIFGIGPLFGSGIKGLPGALEFRRFDQCKARHVSGKTFVQPKIVPPLHGDEVTEPHVGHFVKNNARFSLQVRSGGRSSSDKSL